MRAGGRAWAHGWFQLRKTLHEGWYRVMWLFTASRSAVAFYHTLGYMRDRRSTKRCRRRSRSVQALAPKSPTVSQQNTLASFDCELSEGERTLE